MKREVNISPEYLTDNNNYQKVIDVQENKEVAKKGNAAIIFLLTSTLAATIIIVSCLGAKSKRNIDDSLNVNKINNTTNISSDINNSNEDTMNEIADQSENIEDEVTEDNNSNFGEKEIDYSNVSTFYNHISENRARFGNFAESFQSEEDVKNFIDFLYKFDALYDYTDTTSTINSQDYYDKIIQDYYSSCVKHDVKGQLNLLFNNNKLAKEKVAEAEELAYDLKNGKGTDYTIANKYYTWFLVNLIDDRTKVDYTSNNAPFIDGLREQFEQYRYSGNMLEARKYQKNDSLPVKSIDIYYADEAPEGVEITEIENSLTCPDWGVDNIISKYEEDEEVKLYIKKDGQGSFYRVDEQFEMILNKGKVK